MQKLEKAYIASLIKPRAADSHKGTHGHALMIAGRKGSMGAALIAARACLRSGAGLLTLSVPEKERIILQTGIPEAMLVFREDEKPVYDRYNAAAIGPAIGTGEEAEKIFTEMLSDFNGPFVLDADALTLLSKNATLWKKIPAGTVITPHPKEFDRLFGDSVNAEKRKEKAVAMAAEKNILIILKGHETLITQNTGSFINITGNAGLAKGGSGDMLTGMITAFLAQGYSVVHASCIAVYLHGLAADLTLRSQSMESMLATDVIENIGNAFKEISESRD